MKVFEFEKRDSFAFSSEKGPPWLPGHPHAKYFRNSWIGLFDIELYCHLYAPALSSRIMRTDGKYQVKNNQERCQIVPILGKISSVTKLPHQGTIELPNLYFSTNPEIRIRIEWPPKTFGEISNFTF